MPRIDWQMVHMDDIDWERCMLLMNHGNVSVYEELSSLFIMTEKVMVHSRDALALQSQL